MASTLRRLAAIGAAGATVAGVLRRQARCEEPAPARPAVPAGATAVWSTEHFTVARDALGERLVLAPDGSPYAARPLPAGVEAAYRPECRWADDWDGRAHTKPTAKRVLLLVRHGQYDLAPRDRAAHVLTSLGHEQAASVAERLGRMREEAPLPIVRLVHSDMVRAVQTAAAIGARLPDVPVELEPDLAEGRPCVPQPSRSARRWGAAQVAADGVRIERAFRRLVRRASESAVRDEYVVVVCHANVIRYFVCRALQLPPEAWLRMSLPHCSLTTLCVYPAGRVSMQGFGDAGHLAPRATSR